MREDVVPLTYVPLFLLPFFHLSAFLYVQKHEYQPLD
ncbi:hypothetical protein Pla144_14710 [Bythopirellula polymerisocia]|uniref:Uncharacterized protein n=1 Tax=Bythopirellula polymerisocia TaxID=2528003 RepID=A0A5C6CWS6_9BACT|nr:hypothetical protein Pla144_14710 [Bythopirellula polymerisocia]